MCFLKGFCLDFVRLYTENVSAILSPVTSSSEVFVITIARLPNEIEQLPPPLLIGRTRVERDRVS